MQDHFEMEYVISARAAADAVRLFQEPLIARYRVVLTALFAVGIGLTFTIDPSIGLAVAFPAVLLLAMTWMGFIDRWLNRFRGRGVIGDTCKVRADDQGIHIEHPLASGVVAWSALTKMRANDTSIVFGRDRVLASYIPTSAFHSAADREEFLAFARAHIGKAPTAS